MKRFFCSALFLSLCILINAQILDPLKWSFNVKETGENEQELVFTAKLDKGWHLYGQHIPENGPSSTTFTFSEIKGAELVGKVTPTREPIHKYDPNFEMELTWFENEISFIQKINTKSRYNCSKKSNTSINTKGIPQFMQYPSIIFYFTPCSDIDNRFST